MPACHKTSSKKARTAQARMGHVHLLAFGNINIYTLVMGESSPSACFWQVIFLDSKIFLEPSRTSQPALKQREGEGGSKEKMVILLIGKARFVPPQTDKLYRLVVVPPQSNCPGLVYRPRCTALTVPSEIYIIIDTYLPMELWTYQPTYLPI